jgi:hypothetical protein
MHPRRSDIIGAVVLSAVLFLLVAVLFIGSLGTLSST